MVPKPTKEELEKWDAILEAEGLGLYQGQLPGNTIIYSHSLNEGNIFAHHTRPFDYTTDRATPGHGRGLPQVLREKWAGGQMKHVAEARDIGLAKYRSDLERLATSHKKKSETVRRKYALGYINPNKGRKWSTEFRIRLALVHTFRGLRKKGQLAGLLYPTPLHLNYPYRQERTSA
jgi:hypothetical protein